MFYVGLFYYGRQKIKRSDTVHRIEESETISDWLFYLIENNLSPDIIDIIVALL